MRAVGGRENNGKQRESTIVAANAYLSGIPDDFTLLTHIEDSLNTT